MPDDGALANRLGAISLMINDSVSARVSGATNHNSTDTFALNAICVHKGISVDALAAILTLSHSATVRIIDRLQNSGLVKRMPPKGRRVPIILTPDGGKMRMKAMAARKNALQDVLYKLDNREKQSLNGVLDKILSQIAPSQQEWDKTCRFCDYDCCGGDNCPISKSHLLEPTSNP